MSQENVNCKVANDSEVVFMKCSLAIVTDSLEHCELGKQLVILTGSFYWCLPVSGCR